MTPESRNTNTRRRVLSLTAIVAASLPLTATAFGTAGNAFQVSPLSQPLVRPACRPSANSPLFVSNAQQDTNGTTDSPFIKSIEREMQQAKKKREEYIEKLSTFETKLEQLEQKKNQYLNGSQLGTVDQSFTETTARSAVKAMMWRVIAGSITFITTLKFSGNLATALKVVGSDFFSKAFTMFMGERIMNKSQAGRKSGADSAGRSIAKALIWRLFAICNTLSVSFFFSGDLTMASKIAGSDAIFKTGLMVVYERAWAKIEWGKEYIVDFAI